MTPADTNARNIVLFSDGTGNSRGKLFKTNVWRVYQALDVTDPADPPAPRQFAFYDDGVGSETFRPVALLGGAFGYGLERNVRELYAFLCRTYRQGDRIYAFGFSRGAFTIRILIGLILNQGVLPYAGDERDLNRRIGLAYRAYRRGYKTRLQQWWIKRAKNKEILPPGKAFDDARNTEIEFVGLWDTVDAYGLPISGLAWFIDAVLWPMSMPNQRLGKGVHRAAQALSIDDERYTFCPRLWDSEPADAQGRERIQQVWFAGMHSDVGGGYADEGLSHVSLNWMMSVAPVSTEGGPGLRFSRRIRATQQELGDENGPMNDSRRGIASYYRYEPRDPEKLMGGGRVRVHESVLRRIASGHDGYAPGTLPECFDVQRIDGAVVDVASYVPGWDAERYATGRKQVLRIVARRRIAYFVTLGLSLVLAALPWLLQWATDVAPCTGDCSLPWPLRWTSAVLPDLALPWLDVFARHWQVAVPLAAGVWAAMKTGEKLQRDIREAMRKVWYAVAFMRPAAVVLTPPTDPCGGPASLAGGRTAAKAP